MSDAGASRKDGAILLPGQCNESLELKHISNNRQAEPHDQQLTGGLASVGGATVKIRLSISVGPIEYDAVGIQVLGLRAGFDIAGTRQLFAGCA